MDDFRSDDDLSMGKMARENSTMNRNMKQDQSDEDF